MKIRGKDYTEVKDRIKEFYAKYPNGYLVTEAVWHTEDGSRWLFKATAYPNTSEGDKRYFVGHAFEERSGDDKEVNFSSWVENCETSAIGRAFANMDIGTGEARPSAEEMHHVEAKKATFQSSAPKESTPTGVPSKLRKLNIGNNLTELGKTTTERDLMLIDIQKADESLRGLLASSYKEVNLLHRMMRAYKVEALDKATLQTLGDIKNDMSATVAFVGESLEKPIEALSDGERSLFLENLKKYTLLMVE